MNKLTQEIVDGLHDGEQFYICDIVARKRPSENLVRDIKPQRVTINHVEEFGTRTTVAITHGKEVLFHKLYAPSSYVSHPFNVFKTLEEAKSFYTEQREKIELAYLNYVGMELDIVDNFMTVTES